LAQIVRMAAEHMPGVMAIENLGNSAPWSENSMRSELTNPQAHYFVALEGKEVVGFAGYWAIVDEAHVTNISVHPHRRRKGTGKQLMLALLKSAKDLGLTCSTLDVRVGNLGAIALYKKLGYVECAIRKGYYPNDREDASVMWLYGLDKAL
jgi:ribosomal-protein-alanine N-acetyltransferase